MGSRDDHIPGGGSLPALFVVVREPRALEIARSAEGYLLTGAGVREQAPWAWPEEREPMLLETSMPGVFAAGDVRLGTPRRVASAVGEGATVVRLVHEFLAEVPSLADVARAA